MRITVDRERCCGSGQCVLAAPEVFDQGEADGISFPLVTRPGPDQYSAVRDAVMMCPARAISLSDD